MNEALRLAEALIACPSITPTDGGCQALLEQVLGAAGFACESLPAGPDDARVSNLWAVHRGTRPGPTLVLAGHTDVVPTGPMHRWTSDPFVPSHREGRLHGRGAADMKAGIVAYLMAFDALKRMGYEPAAKVVLQSVVEEECTGNGALACLLEGYTADAALIPEPLPQVMSGQMGVLWMAIEVLGLPVHAAFAHTGVAAIDFANYLVARLRELEARWNQPAARHALYAQHEHPVNFNLGKIAGGEWASSVPTQCRVDLRIGFYPGMKPAEVRKEVEAVLNEAWRSHPHKESLRYSVSYQGFQSEGLVVDMSEPVISELSRAHQDIVGAPIEARASTATTDVRSFHLYGRIPATCYGPAGADIHGIDEWVSIDSMQQVSAVLALFIARWCGLNPL